MEPSAESREQILQNENNSLKEQMKILQAQNKRKDQQLQAKCIVIANCNGQILRLKHDLQILQKKLERAQSKKSFKKRQSVEKKRPVLETDEMPYLVPEMPSHISAASNLSLQAAKLPFPHKLSPIAENNGHSPKSIIHESDNNRDIHIDEWGASVAMISPTLSCERSPKTTIIPSRIATITHRAHADSHDGSTVTYGANITPTPHKMDYSDSEDAYTNDIGYNLNKYGYDGYDYDYDMDTFNNSDNELTDKGSFSYNIMNVMSDEENISPMLTVVRHKSITSQLNLNSVIASKADVLEMETEEECTSEDPYDLELMFRGKSISELSDISDVETEQNALPQNNAKFVSFSHKSGHSQFANIHL